MDANEAKVKARYPDAFLSRSLRYEIWSNRAVIGFGDFRVEAWADAARRLDSALASVQAESKPQTESADAEPLILIGRQMANVFYNCGQSSSTCAPSKALMRELQSDWDAALTRYRAAKGGAR